MLLPQLGHPFPNISNQRAKSAISWLFGEYIPRVSCRQISFKSGWGLVSLLNLTAGHFCMSSSFLLFFPGPRWVISVPGWPLGFTLLLFPFYSPAFSLILVSCFLHTVQLIRLLVIPLLLVPALHPALPRIHQGGDLMGGWAGPSSSFRYGLFVFILRYIRLNHMKLLYGQAKNSQRAATSCGSTNSRPDLLGVGLMSPTPACKPRWCVCIGSYMAACYISVETGFSG